jgi:hypothetical protein
MLDSAALNANFDFGRDAPMDARRAFLGVPRKIKLSPGLSLCRFITPENAKLGYAGNYVFRSPWWFPISTLDEVLRVARLNKVPAVEAARARLAISDPYSPTMEGFCTMVITAPVWAWTGRASGQPKGEPDNVWYIGGEEQIYVPNLADNTGLSSKYAYLHHFGFSEDLI